MVDPEQTVVVFASRRTDHHDAEYHAMAERMEALAREQPGFLEITSVRDPATRVGVTVAYFVDEASARAWKEHPEHRQAQRLGASEFYEWYDVTVAAVVRRYGHPQTR